MLPEGAHACLEGVGHSLVWYQATDMQEVTQGSYRFPQLALHQLAQLLHASLFHHRKSNAAKPAIFFKVIAAEKKIALER